MKNQLCYQHLIGKDPFMWHALSTFVQSLSYIQLFVTPWIAAHEAPLSSTIFQSLLKFVPTESVMLSNNLIICYLLLLLSSVFPSIRVFSNESTLFIKQSIGGGH